MEELKNKDGITLIALIITVIVMLILVGVTITVALNGGLFETATKAATETQIETERERLTEVALGSYDVAEGKIISADELANRIKSSLGFGKSDKTTSSKLVVQGKKELWQIDLNSAKVEPYASGYTYTFTIGELVERGILDRLSSDDESMVCTKNEFFPEGISEELKKCITITTSDGTEIETYNISCSNPSYSIMYEGSSAPNTYTIMAINDCIVFCVFNENNEMINSSNYLPNKDLEFTIST